MAQSEVRIRVEGGGAAEAASALAKFLCDELGVEARSRRSLPLSPRHGSLRSDPVAIATLILTIPSVALSLIEIADRVDTRGKVERLIGWLRRRGADADAQFYLEVLGGVDLRLDDAEPEEMMAALPEGETAR